MSSDQIRVLIVDDSKVSRDLLGYIVGLDPHIKVIGFAENGVEALEFLKKQTPDVVITDIEMPVMNGFQLTRKIMETNPLPIIVISGVYNQSEVATGFEAIEAGALAIIEKPKGLGDSQCMDTARFVAETIKTMSKVTLRAEDHSLEELETESDKRTLEIEPTPDPEWSGDNIDAVGIGASIGGPKAIRTLLSQLPTNFSVPIFVVQHITSGFIDGFVNWLNNSTTFTVKIAEKGEAPQPETVYICPDKSLMGIGNDKKITLDDATASDQGQYSISKLFKTMKSAYGKQCVGVLLTGIGNDGADELLKLKEKGAYTIVQDDNTSVKSELPQSAIEIGAAEKILPLQKIAVTLEHLIGSTKQRL